MVETLRPDVFSVEEVVEPTVPQVPVSTAGFVGVSERGPVNEPTLVSSFIDFQEKFGSFFQGNYLPLAVRNFFLEGGSRCWVVRVVGSGAQAATVDIDDLESPAVTTLTATAVNVGSWGNDLEIDTVSAEAQIATEAASSASSSNPSSINQIEVDNVEGFARGDYIHISGTSPNDLKAFITSIEPVNNIIHFAPSFSAESPIAVDTVVQTVSKHRASSLLAEDLSSGQSVSQVEVQNAINFRVGQLVTLISDSNSEAIEATIDKVSGDVLKFTSSITPSNTMSSGSAFVVSQEFQLKVLEDGNVEERYDFLALNSNNDRDYVENKLSGKSNQSNFVDVTDPGGVSTADGLPAPGQFLLSGGADGSATQDSDFIGSSSNKTGVWAFDQVNQAINFMAVPGVTSESVLRELVTFVETGSNAHAGKSVAILDMPLAIDTLNEALEFKNSTLNIDSSYAAIYYPWLEITDPNNRDMTLDMPPSGSVAGVWSRVSRDRGVFKTPGNEVINNATGIVTDTTPGEHDILNNNNINVIKSEPGRGIRLMGGRTLVSVSDGRQWIGVRLTFNFVKSSLEPALKFALFEPNNQGLRDNIKGVAQNFLSGLWLRGAFVPRSNFDRAVKVKVDEENNPQSEQDKGRLHISVGLAVVKPAEFIIIKFSQLSDTFSSTES